MKWVLSLEHPEMKFQLGLLMLLILIYVHIHAVIIIVSQSMILIYRKWRAIMQNKPKVVDQQLLTFFVV